jgi:hypothetical protein
MHLLAIHFRGLAGGMQLKFKISKVVAFSITRPITSSVALITGGLFGKPGLKDFGSLMQQEAKKLSSHNHNPDKIPFPTNHPTFEKGGTDGSW